MWDVPLCMTEQLRSRMSLGSLRRNALPFDPCFGGAPCSRQARSEALDRAPQTLSAPELILTLDTHSAPVYVLGIEHGLAHSLLLAPAHHRPVHGNETQCRNRNVHKNVAPHIRIHILHVIRHSTGNNRVLAMPRSTHA